MAVDDLARLVRVDAEHDRLARPPAQHLRHLKRSALSNIVEGYFPAFVFFQVHITQNPRF